jgi:hypothetical protein
MSRLLELAQEAEQSANLGNAVDVKLMMQNYAKLIIKECLSLSSDLNPFDAMDAAGAGSESQYGSAALLRVYDNTVDQYYDAIKNHFGVDDEC